jgi:hypothetical protein
MDNNDPLEQQRMIIPLDGSYGTGPLAELTIITRIPETGQLKRETYSIPYFMIDIPRLMRLNDANLILGFELVKGDKTPSGLKELGL